MINKYKPGDKVWVKAEVGSGPDRDGQLPSDGEVAVMMRGIFRWRAMFIRMEDILPDTPPASPWQPIETAPKDGTPIFVRWADGYASCVVWEGLFDAWINPMTYTSLQPPTHWMPIPKLEVE